MPDLVSPEKPSNDRFIAVRLVSAFRTAGSMPESSALKSFGQEVGFPAGPSKRATADGGAATAAPPDDVTPATELRGHESLSPRPFRSCDASFLPRSPLITGQASETAVAVAASLLGSVDKLVAVPTSGVRVRVSRWSRPSLSTNRLGEPVRMISTTYYRATLRAVTSFALAAGGAR